MKKYWPLTLPFLFFGVCYFFMRVKPQRDMLATEQQFREIMLAYKTVDVITRDEAHGINYPQGTLQGDKLRNILANVHLRNRQHFYAGGVTSIIIGAFKDFGVSNYVSLHSDQENGSIHIGSSSSPSGIGRKYEITQESSRSIKQLLSEYWPSKFPKNTW